MNDDEFKFELDNLNDYCLLNIIEFSDLKSKLKLYVTCKRLNHLISAWFCHQVAFGDLKYSQIELCTNEKHNLDEYQYSLKSITENSLYNDWNLNIMMLSRLFQLATNIECLHFNCLDDENSVNEKLIITILGSLPKIKCLSFGIGLQISSKSWSSIVNQLGNQLEHLQINRVNYLTLENIVKRCPNLISLYIRFCPSAIGCVSYLWPKLKKLRLQSMATIYLRNGLFTDRSRQRHLLDNEDDENTIDLAIDDLNNNLRMEVSRDEPFYGRNMDNLNNQPSLPNNLSNLTSRAERYLNQMNNTWYLNLVELRLNRITVKSLTVLFNHCISLQVLDLVLFFNRATIVFENQDFIQLSHRLTGMRLFALDVYSKWNLVQLDNGLALMLQEWPKIEILIIKRGLITEELFQRIKHNCKNLKVISVEFCDQIPYNHRLNEITDRVVDSLVEFNKLTKLRLHFTGLTDDAVIKLVENCKCLKYLDLFGCLKVTDKSLRAIASMLNKTNRCNAIFLSRPTSQRLSTKQNLLKREQTKTRKQATMKSRYNLRKRKSIQSFLQCSIDSSGQSTQSDESINSSLYSCKQFDTITANCVDCGKKPQTFYLSINRTKIVLKKFDQSNTLFIVGEDHEIWNNYNYSDSSKSCQR